MKKALVILIVIVLVGVVAWVGLRSMTGNRRLAPVTTTKVAPTEDLTVELKKTEDDGGAADFAELEKSAEGL